MEAAEIIYQLTHAVGLPTEALKAATERRHEMAPLLVEEIEHYLVFDPGSARREKPNPLFFGFHLLGEWREPSAYRPLARLLRCPELEIDAILGDGITSTSHRVMAAVFDGDPQPLYDIILDPEAEQFVRSRMCETLAMIVVRGELEGAVAERFLRDAFMNLRPQAQSYVWQGWQRAIAMLGLTELTLLVKKAFDRGFIDPQWLSFDAFERDLRHWANHQGQPRWQNDGEYTLFGDTVGELSTWYAFSERQGDQERYRHTSVERAAHIEPTTNPYRAVGRNDRCPCGSGKKYKRCCLR